MVIVFQIYNIFFRFIDENQWSRRQAELFIATQAALLLSDEQSAHTPIELNEKIRNLLKSNPDLAEAVSCMFIKCIYDIYNM